jgi:hypothetical protein
MLPPNRKGTGFTNINRVLTANEGNRLGSTVSSGVQNQSVGVKDATAQSQQKFNEKAQANRLDTDQAKEKRANIIGRFGDTPVQGTQQVANQVANANPPQSRFQVDESKFQVSSGLQNQYNQQKTALQNQQTQAHKTAEQQRATVQARYDADLAEMNRLKQEEAAYLDAIQNSKLNLGINDPNFGKYMEARQGQTKFQMSTDSLKNVLNTLNTTTEAQNQDIANRLNKLEAQYGEMTQAEKNAWVEAERDKLIAANLPTEEEIKAFTKYRTGTYEGPKELEDFQSLLGNASEAEMMGDLTRSGGGRQELLRRFVGGEGYNQGQQRLDNLILGQQSGDELAQARKTTRGLEQVVKEANNTASNQAQEYVNRAKIFGEETTKQLQDLRKPVDDKINARLEQLKAQDTQRAEQLKRVQNILQGADENTKGLDKIARLGLGLQSVQDAGFLNQDQFNELLGKNGLVQRAESLGLDTNKLLSERLQDIGSENLNRGGAASFEQEAQLTALDRLLGKNTGDLEFANKGADYKAGRIGVNTGSLKDYITKTEAERGIKSPVAEETIQQFMSPTGQAVAGLDQIANANNTMGGLAGAGVLGYGGLMGAAAGTSAAAGLAGISPYALAASLGTDALTGGDGTAQAAEGAVNLGAGTYGTAAQGRNAVLEGLMKLNVGGNSLANSPAGSQLSKIISYAQELENKGLGELTKEGLNAADGFRDLTKTGRLDQAITKLSGMDAVKNLYTNAGNTASKALFGGKTGNWDTSEYGTVNAATGENTNIGSFANKSSSEILNQMLSQEQLKRMTWGKGGVEGSKAMNELMNYYKNALKREGKG